MSEDAKPFVGDIFLAIGNGASPESFTRYCEVDTMSGIGHANALIDVTTFCSGGYKQYIGGLSEGKQFTFGANYGMNEPIQEQLIADVESRAIRNVQIQVDGESPGCTFHMALTMLDWELDPQV
ncbi:MAG TPA: hypothetical protein VII35_13695, partial [Steroidobacteraceae bacterium]